MSNKLQWERLIKLVETIKSVNYPNRYYLAEKLEVTERTVQRDIDFLRDRQSAPLEYDRDRGGYYFSEPSWFLPAINLSEGDFFSLMIASMAVAQYRGTPIAEKLESIYRKISGALSEKISVSPDYVSSVLRFAPTTALPVNKDIWNSILKATRENKQLLIQYKSLHSRAKESRKVEPHNIVNMSGDWYLFAYDDNRGKVLQFTINRIEKAEVQNNTFRKQNGFSLNDVMQNSFGCFGSNKELCKVRIRIKGKMKELQAGRIFHPRQSIKNCKDGSMEISFPVSSAGDRPFYHLIRWILSMGSEAEAVSPPLLKRLVKQEIGLMKNNYKNKSQ